VKPPVGKDVPDLESWMAFDEKRKKQGVLSIVGFGGVGKTTIAMALYKKFGPEFQCRAMVTVSQNSDPEVVLMSLVSQVRPPPNSGERQGKDSSMDNKIPVTRSILSRRLRLPCGKDGEDGSAVLQKHGQIQAELKEYLEKNRYSRSQIYYNSSTLDINCHTHKSDSFMVHILLQPRSLAYQIQYTVLLVKQIYSYQSILLFRYI